MISNVRDDDSAELLIHTVQSEQWAFTTVNGPSAIGIVARIQRLDVKK
jgi:hypothetical protein